jgi:uncharacterized membrane protein YjjB (DUF3815 family)
LWEGHNGHRIPIPGIFFTADIELFGGQNKFLFYCNWLFWILFAILFVREIFRERTLSTAKRYVLSGYSLFWIFSARQYKNMIWGWETHMFLSCMTMFIALRCVASLKDSIEERRRGRPSVLLAATIAVSIITNFSFGSGLFIWVAVFTVAILHRLPLRYILALISASIAATGLYFSDLATGRPGLFSRLLNEPTGVLKFFLMYLGAPASSMVRRYGISGAEVAPVAASMVLGAIGLLISIILLVLELRTSWRGKKASRLRVVMLGVVVFVLTTGFATAMVRKELHALAPRFGAFKSMFWAAILVALATHIWSAPRRRKPAIAGLTAILLLAPPLLTIQQVAYFKPWKHLELRNSASALAYVVDVRDETSDSTLHPNHPRLVAPTMKYLKERGLNLFAEKPGAPLGHALHELLSKAASNTCLGKVTSVIPLSDPDLGAVKMIGWAWNERTSSPVERLLILDDETRVIGLARWSGKPPHREAARLTGEADAAWSTWQGYAKGVSSGLQLKVVGILPDQETFCELWSKPSEH